MKQLLLPGTSLDVSRIALGTVPLGTALDDAASFRMIDTYVERGGNLLDTAAVYANWINPEPSASEKAIGRWLKRRGGARGIVISTKGGHPPLGAMQQSRLSEADIAADVHDSLRHLGVDAIDLYWLHRDDANRPAGEIVETMNKLVKAGHIRYFGCSNWRPERIAEAQAYARERGLQPFGGSQILWNLAAINPGSIGDKTLVTMDEAAYGYYLEAGMAVFAYTSQAQGVFSKLAAGGPDSLKEGTRRVYYNDTTLARLERAQRLAARHNVPVSAIVLGSLTNRPFPTVPIIGPASVEQLEQSLEGADIVLTPEELRSLTEPALV
ncbi:MAG: aldo/keto reductase [Paenibacillaceae bacterium]|nr:aldo/keto reductase [Paenibacillaceae bacterium]